MQGVRNARKAGQYVSPAATSAFDTTAEAERIKAEAAQLLSTFLDSVSRSSKSDHLQPGGREYHIIGAAMAPMVQQLAETHSTLRHLEERINSAIHSAAHRESVNALLATALASQSQQIAGLAQLEAANFRSAGAPDLPEATQARLYQLSASPEPCVMIGGAAADKAACSREQGVQKGLDWKATAAGHASASTSAAGAAVFSDGVQIVYPGRNAEPSWNERKGR